MYSNRKSDDYTSSLYCIAISVLQGDFDAALNYYDSEVTICFYDHEYYCFLGI